MRHCHELGECWAAKDCVVLRFPVNDFEFTSLLPKVAWFAEDDFEGDFSEGLGWPGWDDAVELRVCLFQGFGRYAHDLQGAGEEEVQAASSVHEDFAHVEAANLSFDYQ